MDQEDVNRVLDQLFYQNDKEVMVWVKARVKLDRLLNKAEREISALEKAKVLK